jgi:hypothetical protein
VRRLQRGREQLCTLCIPPESRKSRRLQRGRMLFDNFHSTSPRINSWARVELSTQNLPHCYPLSKSQFRQQSHHRPRQSLGRFTRTLTPKLCRHCIPPESRRARRLQRGRESMLHCRLIKLIPMELFLISNF